MSDELKIKILGLPVGRLLGRGKPKMPKDGDGDGFYTMPGSDEDKTPAFAALQNALRIMRGKPKFEMSKSVDRRASAKRWLLAAREGGFTTDKNMSDDIKEGISIGRNFNGISTSVDNVFDETGEVKEEAIDRVLAWLEFHGDKPFNNPLDGAREAGLGGWTEDGNLYIDIVDIYETNEQNLELAKERGKKQDQKSVAILEKVWEAKENQKWDDAFIVTEGSGSSVLPWFFFADAGKMVSSTLTQYSNYKMPRQQREPQNMDRTGPEGVTMQLAEPLPQFAKHLNGDFSNVVAVEPAKRKRIADHYEVQPLVDEKSKKAYDQLKSEVERQFEMLRELGITVEFVDYDPYDGFHSMRKDVVDNKRLKVMKTSVTGSHPYWDDDTNDKFRAVHDVFGHLATGRGFDRHGEEAAYQAHKSMMPEAVHGVLAWETRGQNAFVLDRGDFPPQKAGILPDELAKRLASMQRRQTEGVITADDDNLFSIGGSHHITGGRHFKNKKSLKVKVIAHSSPTPKQMRVLVIE